MDDRLPVCESATLPLYSTWYNFHQFPEQSELLKELAVAKDIGFKTVILDDGWQYDGESTGDYRNCGNWAVAKSKFPNFDEFVSTVHNFGLKLLVWFSVPFVGFDTQDYQTYKDKILYDSQEFRAGILDVRYKEIRDYIVNNYANFVKRYNIYGLKLDFMLNSLIKDYDKLLKRIDAFYVAFRTLWFKENKPQGFDVQDIRIGALKQRVRSCRERLKQYVNKEIDDIPELCDSLLDFDGACLFWRDLVTVNLL